MTSVRLPSLLAACLLVGVVLTACTIDVNFDDDILSGSGQLETRSFEVSNAEVIDLTNGFRAEIIVDPSEAMSIEITTDDNLFELLQVDVVDEELRIGLAKGVRFNTTHPPLAVITVPKLEGISASGGTHVVAEGLDGSLVLIDASGGSVVRLGGAAKSVSIDASGGSQVHAADFYVASAGVDVSGGSQLSIAVSDSLTGDVSTGSRIVVTGQPVQQLDLTFGSTISFVGEESD